MAYAAARLKRDVQRQMLEIYVTDGIKYISCNTAVYGGGTGFTKRYAEFIHKKDADARSGDEIVAELCGKFGWGGEQS